jgi:hypothetical protein
MLGWDRYRFHKKRAQRSYEELVFLHLMGYVSNIVHSGASEERNVDTLFFLLMWDHYGFHKKNAGTRYTVLVIFHPVGSIGVSAFWRARDVKHQCFIFHAQVGPVRIR